MESELTQTLRQTFSVAHGKRRRESFDRNRRCLRLLADDTTHVVVGCAGEAVHLFLGSFAHGADLGPQGPACAPDIGLRSAWLSLLLVAELREDLAGEFALPGMYLLVEMPEFAAGVAQEELALDPDGEAEDVGEEQSAVKRDALEVAVQDEMRHGTRKCSSCIDQKPSARKISVATNTALAIIGILSAAMLRGTIREKRRGVSLSAKEGRRR
jgi:hypothetical protein